LIVKKEKADDLMRNPVPRGVFSMNRRRRKHSPGKLLTRMLLKEVKEERQNLNPIIVSSLRSNQTSTVKPVFRGGE
jgi:hypothetical protein